MPKKIRDLKAMLRRAGFTEASGKGSHVNFWHPRVNGTFITIAGNDGGDAKKYQENQTNKVLKRVKDAKGDES